MDLENMRQRRIESVGGCRWVVENASVGPSSVERIDANPKSFVTKPEPLRSTMMMNRVLLLLSLLVAPATSMMRPLAFVATNPVKMEVKPAKGADTKVILITGASQGSYLL
jgi:hypothetical protein